MVRNKLKNVKAMWVCQGRELPAGEVRDSCSIKHNPGSAIVTVVTLSQTQGWLWSVPACSQRSQQSLSSSRKAAAGKKSGLVQLILLVYSFWETGKWPRRCKVTLTVTFFNQPASENCIDVILPPGLQLPSPGWSCSFQEVWRGAERTIGFVDDRRTCSLFSSVPRGSVVWCLAQQFSCSVLTWLLGSVMIYWI